MLWLLRVACFDVLSHSKAKIIGVTGSVGKSSFVYLLDAVIKNKFKTKTTLSGNSETGIPLEILGLRKVVGDYGWKNWLKILVNLPMAYIKSRISFDYEVVIVEMGIDSSLSPKNMEYLLSMVPVDIGVFLSVALVHSEQFGQELNLKNKDDILQAIAMEKGKLLTSLGKNKIAVINGNIKYIKDLKIAARKIILGKKKIDINIKNYMVADEQMVGIEGVIEVARHLGIKNAEKVIEEKFVMPPGRASILDGYNGSYIVDSSYNSSPIAVEIMIKEFKKLKIESKKYLVLGDMRELGEMAEQEHKNLAKYIDDSFFKVILVGKLMKKYLVPKVKAMWFGKSKGVGECLKKKLKKGDWVLVKGSQNTIFLEQAVKEMMAEPEKAKELLCRQSEYWESVRQKFYATR